MFLIQYLSWKLPRYVQQHAKSKHPQIDVTGSAAMLIALAQAHCLWCGKPFSLEGRVGLKKKFCCTTHRQAFWIAARRWTLLAIDAGLLSVNAGRPLQ